MKCNVACILFVLALGLAVRSAAADDSKNPAAAAVERIGALEKAAISITKIGEDLFAALQHADDNAYASYQSAKDHDGRQRLIEQLKNFAVALNSLARKKDSLATALEAVPRDDKALWNLLEQTTSKVSELADQTASVLPLLPLASKKEGKAALDAFEDALSEKGFLMLLEEGTRDGKKLDALAPQVRHAANALRKARDAINELTAQLVKLDTQKN